MSLTLGVEEVSSHLENQIILDVLKSSTKLKMEEVVTFYLLEMKLLVYMGYKKFK
jgi:hypothetical protein